MRRRVFLSYQHLDQLKAKGFNLMRYNKALGLEFVTRGLLDPVMSTDPSYIGRKIKEALSGTSVTVVLLGDDTTRSEWVAKEIAWSREKGNGIVAIRLSPNAAIPAGLDDAEILNWNSPDDVKEFGPAIERAASGARQMANASELIGTSGGQSCGR